MVSSRPSDNLTDFVRDRRAHLQASGKLSDRLVSAILTFALCLGSGLGVALLAVKALPPPPPPIMMAEVLSPKLPPPPKLDLKRHFLKVPLPEVPPPVIPASAPMGQVSAPATTKDPVYIESIAQRIRAAFQPVADGHQGVVNVHFVIDRQGKFLFLGIARTSGFPALDDAALAQMHRAEPLPPIPDDVQGDNLYLLMPLCFKAGNAC